MCVCVGGGGGVIENDRVNVADSELLRAVTDISLGAEEIGSGKVKVISQYK